MNINALAFGGKQCCLLVSDEDVSFVTHKKGVLERVAVFVNDESGIDQFIALLRKNASVYKNRSFYILMNIIGEEYRVENVAHLVGKFKTDFHNRRMHQLFRGSSICSSFVQGRDERGRREDIVLFYGLLTEGKVLPWINAITKGGERHLAGVQAVSFVSTGVLKVITNGWNKSNHLLLTMHENGSLRQTYHEMGKVKFSRISKILTDDIEEISKSVVKEVDRTIQYLNSLKVPISGKISVQFVCPSSFVGQLRETIESTDKISFYFSDASSVARGIGLVTPIGELGRDSSLSLRAMFVGFLLTFQLAPFSRIRYHYMRLISRAAIVIFGIYGAVGLSPPLSDFYRIAQLSLKNSEFSKELEMRKKYYEAELRFSEEPPSTPDNIVAVSRSLSLLSSLDLSPSPLFYFFSSGFDASSGDVLIRDMHWYVTGDVDRKNGSVDSFIKGGNSVFQILEVSGEFLSTEGETYLDVANRADRLFDSFGIRSDIAIDVIKRPDRDLSNKGDSISGTLTDDYAVDAARNRVFEVRIIWKMYDQKTVDEMIGEAKI